MLGLCQVVVSEVCGAASANQGEGYVRLLSIHVIQIDILETGGFEFEICTIYSMILDHEARSLSHSWHVLSSGSNIWVQEQPNIKVVTASDMLVIDGCSFEPCVVTLSVASSRNKPKFMSS